MEEDKKAAPDRSNLTWVRLNCDRRHVASFRQKREPEVGEEIWCSRCTEFAEVVEVVPLDELRLAKCSCKKFSRNYGIADLKARVGVTKHARNFPGHEVTLRDGNGTLLQTSEWSQETLSDLPGF